MLSPPARATRFAPQANESCGLMEPSAYIAPAVHAVPPVFRIVTDAVNCCPIPTVVGTFCETNAASGGPGVDVTTMLAELSPNHVTPSCTIRHWKLYVPAGGAVT